MSDVRQRWVHHILKMTEDTFVSKNIYSQKMIAIIFRKVTSYYIIFYNNLHWIVKKKMRLKEKKSNAGKKKGLIILNSLCIIHIKKPLKLTNAPQVLSFSFNTFAFAIRKKNF